MTRQTAQSAEQRLNELFALLFGLNPYIAEARRTDFEAASAELGADAFPSFARKTEQLVEAYLDSQAKVAERRLMASYGGRLRQAAKQLAAKGAIGPVVEADSPSLALVPRDHYSALDWLQILDAAQIEDGMTTAVDAALRRHELIPSVLETAFMVLHRLDEAAAFAWEMAYLDAHRESLDPDLVRDVARAWSHAESLPPAALNWLCKWSGDERLQRERPVICRTIDRALRRHVLRRWAQTARPTDSNALHLRMIIREHAQDEGRLQRWLDTAVADMGDAVEGFMQLALRQRRGRAGNGSDGTPGVMVHRLHALVRLFQALLILADLLVQQPGVHTGLHWRFGLSRPGLERRREALREQAAVVIRGLLLEDLRHQRTPLATIRRFCLGDSVLYQVLENGLDLLTKEFDSVEQRERVVQNLAVNYGSFCEVEALNREITTRYRNLMRLLHEDSLTRLFRATPEALAPELTSNLVEVAASAADARNFLIVWRNPGRSLNETLASELNFVDQARARRLRLSHTLLTDNLHERDVHSGDWTNGP